MIWYGSMMSQVLQWTQFEKLIWSFSDFGLPSFFGTISYTAAGQNFSHGLPYSVRQVVSQMFGSATCRCAGWSSS